MDVVGTFKVNMGAGASHILAILTIWGPLGVISDYCLVNKSFSTIENYKMDVVKDV